LQTDGVNVVLGYCSEELRHCAWAAIPPPNMLRPSNSDLKGCSVLWVNFLVMFRLFK
jgi:hypothetical protein